MYTILGAGGAIANEFTKVLLREKQPVRLISRNPKPVTGAETKAADITDFRQLSEAAKGSSIIVLAAGLKYDLAVWKKLWPRIMLNTIAACRQNNARLIFFDNIYCLGKVNGEMTEETEFNPSSKKGEIRAQIAGDVLMEIKSGNMTAMIARSADFYGPGCRTSMFNIMVADRLAKGKKAQWLVNDKVPHSFTYTPDCGEALWQLSKTESAWNQLWHMPTAYPALTGKQLIELAAKHFHIKPRYSILGKGMVRLAGLFNTTIKELYEMLYQNDSDYIFSSAKIEKALGIVPTSYDEGVRTTVESYRK